MAEHDHDPAESSQSRSEDSAEQSEAREEGQDRALDDALNALERMIGPADGEGQEEPEGEYQYTIPMLDDVVPTDEEPETEMQPEPRAGLSLAEDEICRRLVARLSSEIEVLVQSGVDDALRAASRSISRKVRDHMDIMLPEILEELARAQRNDDP